MDIWEEFRNKVNEYISKGYKYYNSWTNDTTLKEEVFLGDNGQLCITMEEDSIDIGEKEYINTIKILVTRRDAEYSAKITEIIEEKTYYAADKYNDTWTDIFMVSYVQHI